MFDSTDPLAVRMGGVLVHPTSLPGPGPIGTLGEEAYAFVDFLAAARQRVWQMLPLGPTTGDGSPYRALSAFAGNPWLIVDDASFEQDHSQVGTAGNRPADFVEADRRCRELVDRAHEDLEASGDQDLRDGFTAFRERHRVWLEDFALYVALRDRYGQKSWVDWPRDLAVREPASLEAARRELAETTEQAVLAQFLFDQQWLRLKAYANAKGVMLVGDIPIYVNLDSADVWANQELFDLDESGRPIRVAGVPPDYFSATGQRWGNPLYRWEVMAEHGFDWWTRRFRRTFELVDVVRIDHFRGFEAYWRIPAEEETAVRGEWVGGPGAALFEAVARDLGPLPVIAEDLGLITDSVRALRDALGFPGMRILQFAFDGDPKHPYLPENYVERCVAYPGTHDNDTSVGWYDSLSEQEREHVHEYLGAKPNDPAWALIEVAWRSPANLAIATLQDLLSLGTEARMNIPGKATGNWRWRLPDGGALQSIVPRLAALTIESGRAGG